MRSFFATAIFIFLTGLIGCSRPLDAQLPENKNGGNSPASQTIYPHSAAFKLSHGTHYQSRPEGCVTCHGTDLRGGTSKTSCYQCHASYPHSDDFKGSRAHGEEFLSLSLSHSKPIDCFSCHGIKEPKTEKSQATNCLACHAYPHPPAWTEAKNHGAAFVAAKDKQACLQCHAQDGDFQKRHPEQFVSCATCHLPMPHSKAFDDNHTSAGVSHGSSCVGCHQDYKRNTPNLGADGCMTCHDGKIESHWIEPKPKPKAEDAKKEQGKNQTVIEREVASETLRINRAKMQKLPAKAPSSK
jgi:hypothetical protein